ncbi:hypothetical protein [Mycolicibacterium mucogenicum]|uniref:Uncharacterized protein n=1 Tax=Mycolicibacterium mucogenicum DSM 44124 TaxID=1226753 RepID=A0A8H2JAB3_MYCMU|nr:hypothetical protein [Mycolicibacterium mucogenicum]KAB7754241.1 hypothetical protein MMUC44124_22265 [Mycolicibacterium mucogenicum DSM 44124]QPG70735.1 hypothetical protein C1S78_007180 [Mycolicibacterium mucogenicum DSM 44124]
MNALGTWDDWQQALAQSFLEPGLIDEPVIFFVDDFELTAIGGEDARTRLTGVVSAALQETNSPYSAMLLRARGWSPSEKHPPPTLPLLATTVLAATDMEASQGISSQDYYTRLTQVLDPVGDAAVWRHRLERDFPSVAAAWRDLHQWIVTSAGRVSTIVENPYPAHIGYPLSQALIRRADQNALTHFWDRAGLEPGENQPTGSELLRDLKEWMTPYRGFSQSFQRTVAGVTGKVAELFEALLRQAARGWDGRVRNRSGRIVPRCRLSAWEKARVCELEWLLGPPDDPEQLRPSPFQQAQLIDGFWDEDGDGAPLHPAAAVIILRFDPVLQRWVEVPNFRLQQEHALVWNTHIWGVTAQEFVTSSYNGSAGMIRSVAGSPKLRAVFGIFFTDQNVLESALSKAALKGFVFDFQQRPRLALVDGLKISNALGRRVYVRGGPPDIMLPAGAAGEVVDVVLNGDVTTFARSGLSFALKPLGLECGDYDVSADDTTLRFEVTEEPEAVLGRPERSAIAFLAAPGGAAPEACPTPDSQRVRGALVITPDGAVQPDPWDLYAIGRRKMTYTYLLGRKGYVRQVSEPEQTDLWALVGGLAEPLTFTLQIHPWEYWMVQVGSIRTYVDSIGGVRSRAFSEPATGVDHARWRQIVIGAAGSSSAPEWLALVADAERGSDR